MSLLSLLMQDRVTVESQTATPDASGGPERQAGAVVTDIPFRIEPLDMAERAQYAAMDQDVSHRGFTQYASLVYGDLVKADGGDLVLRVQAVTKHRRIGSMPDYYEVLLFQLVP